MCHFLNKKKPRASREKSTSIENDIMRYRRVTVKYLCNETPTTTQNLLIKATIMPNLSAVTLYVAVHFLLTLKSIVKYSARLTQPVSSPTDGQIPFDYPALSPLLPTKCTSIS